MKTALEAAMAAWEALPLHKKMIAGDVVAPILATLADLQRQLNELGLVVAEIKGAKNGKS